MAATMKRDDMIKERGDLIWAVGHQAIMALKPFCSIMSGVARFMYLDEEIKKVTPKPAAVPSEPATVENPLEAPVV